MLITKEKPSLEEMRKWKVDSFNAWSSKHLEEINAPNANTSNNNPSRSKSTPAIT
jgi:hypothetical protein